MFVAPLRSTTMVSVTLLSPLLIAFVAKASVLPSSSVIVIVFVPLVRMPSDGLLRRTCSVSLLSCRSSLASSSVMLWLVTPLVNVTVPLVAV